MAFFEVNGLRKKYGDVWAVDNVTFEVEEGKLLVLLGPSGCGKTTTLRCIGGLERPEDGEIVIDGEPLTHVARNIFLQPEARGMGMVAQSYAIWPHMSVFENVAFPLRMQRLGRKEIGSRVGVALKVVKLDGLGNRNATDLSGGQQQRVALARAIVGKPKVLLFDEPLSNLDAKLREEMRYLLKDIQREINITAIYVTHDQAEAMALGDELLVMNTGKIEQRGSARSLYLQPSTRFVADFIGVANLIEGRRICGQETDDGQAAVELLGKDGATNLLRVRSSSDDAGNTVSVLVRPEWMTVHRAKPENDDNLITGSVDKSQYLGDRTEILVDTSFAQIRVWTDRGAEIAPGNTVHLRLDADRCIILPAH